MCNSASWPSGRACPRPPAGTLDAAPALPTPPWHPTADQTRFIRTPADPWRTSRKPHTNPRVHPHPLRVHEPHDVTRDPAFARGQHVSHPRPQRNAEGGTDAATAPPAPHHGTTPLPATPERPPAVTHPHLPRHHAARDRLRVQPEAPSPTRTQAPRCWQTWELSVQHPRPPGTHDVGARIRGRDSAAPTPPWHTPGPAQTARSRKPPAGAPLARAEPRRRPGQIRETRSVPTLSPQVAIPWRPVAPRPASGGTP